MEGHIVIRVLPKGEEYTVFVLDDMTEELAVVKESGPYLAK